MDRPACADTSLSPCPGGIRTSEAAILPFSSYLTCLATGSLPATHLPVLQPRRTTQSGAPHDRPHNGHEVPVLAVTLHWAETRQWLTWGDVPRIHSPRPWPSGAGGPHGGSGHRRHLTDPGSRVDENTGLLVARVPSFCPPSSLSGLASQAPLPSTPDPPRFWSSLQPPHPKPAHISTLHALATFPLLPGFPHPHFQHSAPAPPRVEAGVRTELLLQ